MYKTSAARDSSAFITHGFSNQADVKQDRKVKRSQAALSVMALIIYEQTSLTAPDSI